MYIGEVIRISLIRSFVYSLAVRDLPEIYKELNLKTDRLIHERTQLKL
jgi:hypothetical protein